VFCGAYVFVFARDLPLFRYYPLRGVLNWGPANLDGLGPAMAWYGLMCSAAAIASLAAVLVPDRVVLNVMRGYVWLFPLATMLVCVFLLRQLFA
jgi:hypothetical protein